MGIKPDTADVLLLKLRIEQLQQENRHLQDLNDTLLKRQEAAKGMINRVMKDLPRS